MKQNLAAGILWMTTLLVGASPFGLTQAFDVDGKRATEFNFVQTGAFDFATILPAPPAPGSLADQADLNAVLQVQAWRTSKQIAWAKRIKIGDLFDFAEVLGEWFAEDELPVTAAFMMRVSSDLSEGIHASKKFFARPRPFIADARVKPCIKRLDTESYPSGHALSFFVDAGVLAEIFPEKRAALFEYAQKMAWGRVIGGVHYPTDLVGGRIFAATIVAELKKSPAFNAALEKSRVEMMTKMNKNYRHSWSE